MTNLSTQSEFQSRKLLIMATINEMNGLFPPSNGSSNTIPLFFSLFIVWILTSLWLLLFSIDWKRKTSKELFFAAFHDKIRKTLPSQRTDTYSTLLMGVNRVLRPNAEEPTVFLVLVPEGSLPTAKQLVVLLVHCTLVSFGYPANVSCIKSVLSDGCDFTSYDDEFPFVDKLRQQLRQYGIAAVFSFEQLHPQVVRTMQHLVPVVFAPYPESVVVLVANIRNQFTEYRKKTFSPNQIGQIFLQELLSPYFDQTELIDTITQIGSRCVLVNPENRQDKFINVV